MNTLNDNMMTVREAKEYLKDLLAKLDAEDDNKGFAVRTIESAYITSWRLDECTLNLNDNYDKCVTLTIEL